MVKILLKVVIAGVLSLAAYFQAGADIIVNEVMSNEPGSATTLEWIEIYNNSEIGLYLGWYSLNIDGTTLLFPGEVIGAGEYVIVCRKLYADGASPGFESYWGDSSGVWGDNTTLEYYTVYDLGSFSLRNDIGAAALYFGINLISEIEWLDAGPDGVSWERRLPSDTVIGSSVDPGGSTPGMLNSITPLPQDLALMPVAVRPEASGLTGFEIGIVNVGLETVSGNNLKMYYDPDADTSAESSDLIAMIDFPQTDPADTVIITTYFELEGVYPYILIVLPSDDRMRNNIRLINAFGKEYPPVVLSEFIADPLPDLGIEWVELKNRSEVEIDLNGWYLGDSIKLHPIIVTEYIVPVGGYAVLCKDSAGLAGYYGADDFAVLEMSSWPILNNNGDLVRLVDNFGFVADSFHYEFAFGGNYSWGRSEEVGMTDRWGRSVSSGGTPGRANEIYYQPSSESIRLTAKPNPFSPSKDEYMVIDFSVPPGENVTMKVYDTRGRVVKTLLDGLPAFDGSIQWNGRSDDERILRVGMYILFFEVSGVDQYKQTIVIAP